MFNITAVIRKCTTKEPITELFPNMNKLFVHAFVLPVSSIDFERCFSVDVMKRVKTISQKQDVDNHSGQSLRLQKVGSIQKSQTV